jgi:SRSO17 transposase
MVISVHIESLEQQGYEGRGWRGFHHHATLCIMASSFASEVFSPLTSTSDAQRLRYPRAGDPEGIPVRPERHNSPLIFIS